MKRQPAALTPEDRKQLAALVYEINRHNSQLVGAIQSLPGADVALPDVDMLKALGTLASVLSKRAGDLGTLARDLRLKLKEASGARFRGSKRTCGAYLISVRYMTTEQRYQCCVSKNRYEHTFSFPIDVRKGCEHPDSADAYDVIALDALAHASTFPWFSWDEAVMDANQNPRLTRGKTKKGA